MSSSTSVVTAFSPQGTFTSRNTQGSSSLAPRRTFAAATSVALNVHMSTVLDRPTTVVNPGTATPAVNDNATVEKSKSPVKEKKRTGSEAWEVRIFNDGKNTREFVARCLVQIVGQSEITAYQTMMQAHQNGVAVVGRYVYEVAEMYYGALKKNGIICDIVPVDEER
eukprot:CAMPEP_0176482816 /NCGR_PEP_ID=MMETSP0200_2-20121128/3579_1 /TAXON_ID=947934 /ORGANISM="Chaetoceros sp., Strain GSL56" /LENGTH=166 /DNA_ID=CAMNT_0017879161 /DNA_START=311 /DNA_END=811 /DNA_ORIENTATION=-